MTDDWCRSCRHCQTRDDPGHGAPRQWCVSPQIKAATNGRAARTCFERDAYDKEWNRDKPETRKCGPDHLNWENMRDATSGSHS